MAVRPWRLLSLCAGVGGLDLGVRLTEPEARTVCFVEREAPAASILVARMEDGWLHPAPIWSDLVTFDAGAWRGAVDCVVSGDPCQPNSVAGKGLGEDDDRWLADRVVDTFDRSGARRLFRENVPGNADGQLGYFVPALERLGCRVAVGLFSAKEIGFAHGRERLFIMADRIGEGWRSAPGADQTGHGGMGEQGGSWRSECGGHAVGRSEIVGGGLVNGYVAHAEGERSGEGRAEPAGQQGRSGVAIAGDGMANAASRGRDTRPEDAASSIIGLSGSGRPAFAGDGGSRMDCPACGGAGHIGPFFPGGISSRCGNCELVDPDRQNPQRGGQCSDPAGRQEPAGYAGLAGRGLVPLVAPGPSDQRWPDIIARAPHLEPAVRRVAHGMADRVDRLRACGNGVVPLVAGYAWRTLEARLAAAAAADIALSAA